VTDEMIERGSIRLAELELGHGIWPTLTETQKLLFNFRFEAALTAALGDGVVVPREPTEEMCNAVEAWRMRADGPRYVWEKMLSAIPRQEHSGEVSTLRGAGRKSDCPGCVASKFACDEHHARHDGKYGAA
jgi:hypothetical protein